MQQKERCRQAAWGKTFVQQLESSPWWGDSPPCSLNTTPGVWDRKEWNTSPVQSYWVLWSQKQFRLCCKKQFLKKKKIGVACKVLLVVSSLLFLFCRILRARLGWKLLNWYERRAKKRRRKSKEKDILIPLFTPFQYAVGYKCTFPEGCKPLALLWSFICVQLLQHHARVLSSQVILYQVAQKQHFSVFKEPNVQKHKYRKAMWLLTGVCRRYTGVKPDFFQNLSSEMFISGFYVKNWPSPTQNNIYLSSCAVRP